jgi:hypothetical protein
LAHHNKELNYHRILIIFGIIFLVFGGLLVRITVIQIINYPRYSRLAAIQRQGPLLKNILRGSFFAILLYPFYDTIIKSKYGWLMLFGVLWGFTFVGSVSATPGSIEGLIYTKTPLAEHLIGIPEVTVQMLAFSWLFFIWERKVNRNQIKLMKNKQSI